MVISRKLSKAREGPAEEVAPAPSGAMPRRLVAAAILVDGSGSMGPYRERQGAFVPAVLRRLVEIGGPKVAPLIYVLYAVVSGGVALSDFAPLDRAAEPPYEPGGETPLGRALSALADRCEEFFTARVFPAGSSVRDFSVLVFSDLRATGETDAETAAGVERFLEVVRKYRAKVTVVAPDPGATDLALARRLDVSERGVRFLDSDPAGILDITLDSLLQSSRKLTGSDPRVRQK